MGRHPVGNYEYRAALVVHQPRPNRAIEGFGEPMGEPPLRGAHHNHRCVTLCCKPGQGAGRITRKGAERPLCAPGFGWHYDAEDVFIAQTAGEKDYYFRENTVEADTPFPPKDFQAYHAETSALQTAHLVAGDFLYIPARWWHMALCREDALSISVGVMPPDTRWREKL